MGRADDILRQAGFEPLEEGAADAAAESIRERPLMPVGLSSAELKTAVPRYIREQSIYSARQLNEEYLEYLREVLASLAEGKINDTKGREMLAEQLGELGFEVADAGGVNEHGSIARLRLIVETNTAQVSALAMETRGADPDIAEAYPAYELVRGRRSMLPRDWTLRFRQACEACGWEGCSRREMAATRRSPVWQSLGDGAGGYDDTLGNPYPPFAWGSGMRLRELSVDEARAKGVPI